MPRQLKGFSPHFMYKFCTSCSLSCFFKYPFDVLHDIAFHVCKIIIRLYVHHLGKIIIMNGEKLCMHECSYTH